MQNLRNSIIVVLLLSGCSYPAIEYREIYLPVKCGIDLPVLPKKTDDIVENQSQLIVYTKELEFALQCCAKGECK